MEKSIENIWKEGFLNQEALIVPKLNDLYNQKSQHIVDKINRMSKINKIAIIIGSILLVPISYAVKIPVMGVMIFFIVNLIVILNLRFWKALEKVDKTQNSYEYLKAFQHWLKEQVSFNKKLARFYYPFIFLAIVLGFWYSPSFQQVYQEIIGRPHEIYFYQNIPVFWVLGMVFIMVILAFLGGRIYEWDVRLIYGSVITKLDEIIADMESLRNQ